MAEELRDSLGRLRITAETDAALEAFSRVFGVSKHDKARAVLHEWAVQQLHLFKVGDSLAPREGSPGKGGG